MRPSYPVYFLVEYAKRVRQAATLMDLHGNNSKEHPEAARHAKILLDAARHWLGQYLGDIPWDYDPTYGDERICNCEHSYYRHFDSYEQMKPVGCKYCSCETFEERIPE